MDDPTDNPQLRRGFMLTMKSAPLFKEDFAGATKQVHTTLLLPLLITVWCSGTYSTRYKVCCCAG
jgi:hypothetical protein